MILVEAALKVHLVFFNLGCQGLVARIFHGVSLLAVVTLSVFVLQVSDGTVKLLLKHEKCVVNRILSQVFCKVWVLIFEVIKFDVELGFGFLKYICDLILALATAYVFNN
jgi:hypothetical protein